MEATDSPYLELHGLKRMVLLAASCIAHEQSRTLTAVDLLARVKRECLERNEDAPQDAAIQESISHLVAKDYLRTQEQGRFEVTQVGDELLDRPHRRPSSRVKPKECVLTEAVGLLHELIQDISSAGAYSFDPRVNVHGQVLHNVVVRWANELGLKDDLIRKALGILVQCGCVSTLTCAFSTYLGYLLGRSPLPRGHCRAEQLLRICNASSCMPAEGDSEAIEHPLEPRIFRGFLFRLFAGTELPVSERVMRYPTIETRETARAWVEKHRWPKLGMLITDAKMVTEKLLNVPEDCISLAYLESVPPVVLDFARALPEGHRENAEATLAAVRFPCDGTFADAVRELVSEGAIRPSEIRSATRSRAPFWIGTVFRANPEFGEQYGHAIGRIGTVEPNVVQLLGNAGAHDSASASKGTSSPAPEQVPLTSREHEVWQRLEFRILSSDSLATLLGGALDAEAIPPLIRGIRKKLGREAIQTVRGRGYFRPDSLPPEEEFPSPRLESREAATATSRSR